MAGRGRGVRSLTTALRAAVAAALTGLVVACAAVAPAGSGSGDGATALSAGAATISETGSSLLYPLASTWATGYHRANPGVTVSTASTGSGAGIAAAAAGHADVGASDAYLSSGDLVKTPALLNIPLVVSAQTVIYNLPGLSQGTHVSLNGSVLAGMYDGTITMWDDPAIKALNPQLTLPAIKIVPVHRSDSSGDTFLFTSYLSTQDSQWDAQIGYGTTAAWPRVAGAPAEKGSVNMLHACAATPGCVAYNGISYLARARAAGLGEAELANAVGRFTLPTPAAIQAAVASFVSLTPPGETISMIDGPAAAGYPIVNYEYAVVSRRQPNASKASAVKAFLRWAITTGNGASYVDPVGFQPLPGALVALGEQQIGEIGT